MGNQSIDLEPGQLSKFQPGQPGKMLTLLEDSSSALLERLLELQKLRHENLLTLYRVQLVQREDRKFIAVEQEYSQSVFRAPSSKVQYLRLLLGLIRALRVYQAHGLVHGSLQIQSITISENIKLRHSLTFSQTMPDDFMGLTVVMLQILDYEQAQHFLKEGGLEWGYQRVEMQLGEQVSLLLKSVLEKRNLEWLQSQVTKSIYSATSRIQSLSRQKKDKLKLVSHSGRESLSPKSSRSNYSAKMSPFNSTIKDRQRQMLKSKHVPQFQLGFLSMKESIGKPGRTFNPVKYDQPVTSSPRRALTERPVNLSEREQLEINLTSLKRPFNPTTTQQKGRVGQPMLAQREQRQLKQFDQMSKLFQRKLYQTDQSRQKVIITPLKQSRAHIRARLEKNKTIPFQPIFQQENQAQTSHKKPNDFQVHVYPDGKIYQGSFLLGKREGQGTLLSPDNLVLYQGQWLNDQFNGEGTFYFPKNTSKSSMDPSSLYSIDLYARIYEGKFKDGMKHGRGKLTTRGNQVFEGEFRFDFIEGEGHFKGQQSQLRGVWRRGILIKKK